MRVPVLSADLPAVFNKVSNYIGNNWPKGKINLMQSRETLAYLLGYDSFEEVNFLASSNPLPDAPISMSDVIKSIAVRALYKFGVKPDAITSLIYQAPLNELSFYAATDTERERRAREESGSGKYFIYDESDHLINYKSPLLLIEQFNQRLLPPYKYAVDHNGLIFNWGDYEAILHYLGGIEDAVANIDDQLSVSEFVEQCILPLAWSPVDAFLASAHVNEVRHWQTPKMIRIECVKQGSDSLGYLVFHQGLNAYYPVVCETVGALNDVLSKLFQKKVIRSDNKLRGVLKTSMALSPKPLSNNHWVEKNFDNVEHLNVSGQNFTRTEIFQAYPQLVSNEMLISFLETEPTIMSIPTDVMGSNVYLGHTAIQQGKSSALNSAKIAVESSCIEQRMKVIKYLFDDEIISLKAVSDDLGNEDLSFCNRVGTEVVRLHPELEGVIETEALGCLYLSYEKYVNGNRFAYKCSDRDIGFLSHAISLSPMLSKYRGTGQDGVLAGAIILANFTASPLQHELESIAINYENILAMLTLHRNQSPSINCIETYFKFLSTLNSDFLDHGCPAAPKQKSYGDSMREFIKASRGFRSTQPS
jgi:hypothetical protein